MTAEKNEAALSASGGRRRRTAPAAIRAALAGATLSAALAGGAGAGAATDSEAMSEVFAYAAAQGSTGLVIFQDGELLAERFWDPDPADADLARMTSGRDAEGNTIEDVASVQKSVVAFLLGVAEGRGLVDLERPVSEVLGEGWSAATVEQEAAITLRHLVTMTSGLDERLAYRGPAGSIWAYNTTAYSRTVSLLEAATGLEIEDLTREWLTGPVGMEDSHWLPRPWAAQSAAAANTVGFHTTARDLVRFGRLVLARGSWQGVDLLGNPTWFERMLSPSQDLNRAYGLLWWLNEPTQASGSRLIPSAPSDLVAAQGALGRKCYVVPSLGLAVTRLGGQPEDERGFNEELWRRLMAALPVSPDP